MLSEKVKNRITFIINVVFIAVVVTLVYLAFQYVIEWVLPFLLAFLIVSAVHPLIRVIKKRLRFKQEVVSIFVMVLIYLIVAVLLFVIVMQLFLLAQDGIAFLPAFFEDSALPTLNRLFDSAMAYINDLPAEWQAQIASMTDQIIGSLQSGVLGLSRQGVSFFSSMAGSVPSFLIGFVFTIMLSFFISIQYDAVTGFLQAQMSDGVKRVVLALRVVIKETILKYLKAALTLISITFVELCIGLLVLQVEYAIPIAAGIAVFDAMPFFGTGAIVVPWAIIELLTGNYFLGFGLAIIYAVVFLVRQMIEPKIVGDRLGLNPIVSLTAIYLGFKLFGVLGMIFMPITTQIVIALHKNGTIRLPLRREQAENKE
jgi:sporulation integral membrane protein YtvI